MNTRHIVAVGVVAFAIGSGSAFVTKGLIDRGSIDAALHLAEIVGNPEEARPAFVIESMSCNPVEYDGTENGRPARLRFTSVATLYSAIDGQFLVQERLINADAAIRLFHVQHSSDGKACAPYWGDR